MIFKFCPVCGAGMEPFTEDGLPREKCVNCGWVHYHNPRPTVSAIISRDGGTQYSSTNSVTSRQSSDEHRSERREKILLSRRLVNPSKGMWDLPGGFMEEKESPEEGVKREVKEELGVGVEIKNLIGVFGPTSYPFDGQKFYNVDIYYEVKIISGEPKAIAGSDVMEIGWFDPDNLPLMAFETNVKAIEVWKKLLKVLSDRQQS